MVRPPKVLGRLNGNAHPHIGWPLQLEPKLRQPLRSLGEDLERMPRGLLHGAEDLSDEGEGNLLVEKVAHAVHEDRAGLLPCERQFQTLWPKSEVEALLEVVAWNATPALGKNLGIAMLAAGTNLRTTCDRVPGRIRPLN